MGRSVSYPSEATVVTFKDNSGEICDVCNGTGEVDDETCEECDGQGMSDMADSFDMLIDDFRDQLRVMFPSVVHQDTWIGREDHVLAGNKLALFGMSEYCGLVSYWIVPQAFDTLWGDEPNPLAKRWIASIADKFVAAFGELSKVGSMSNGEGVYRRIDK